MSVSVGKIAKVMADDCPYRVWKEMRDTKSRKDKAYLKKWRQQHEELVDFFVAEFKENNPSWIVVTEHGVEKDDISGRIDVLARGKGNKFIVWEIKTGKEYPRHRQQLNLYMAIEKMHNPDADIKGALKYIDREPVRVGQADTRIWEQARQIRDMLANDKAPDRKKSRQCRWCDYHSMFRCPK